MNDQPVDYLLIYLGAVAALGAAALCILAFLGRRGRKGMENYFEDGESTPGETPKGKRR